jgi:hypothetical protein
VLGVYCDIYKTSYNISSLHSSPSRAEVFHSDQDHQAIFASFVLLEIHIRKDHEDFLLSFLHGVLYFALAVRAIIHLSLLLHMVWGIRRGPGFYTRLSCHSSTVSCRQLCSTGSWSKFFPSTAPRHRALTSPSISWNQIVWLLQFCRLFKITLAIPSLWISL